MNSDKSKLIRIVLAAICSILLAARVASDEHESMEANNDAALFLPDVPPISGTVYEITWGATDAFVIAPEGWN